MSNSTRHLELASKRSQDRINDRQARHQRNLNRVTAGTVGLLGVGFGGGYAIRGVEGLVHDISGGSTPKVAKLTKEQAGKTTLKSMNVAITPMPQAEVNKLPQLEVPAQNGEGTWGLAKSENGVIPNPVLRHEVQTAILHEADETTGGIKNGDEYGIPVLPEQFMGADHPVIPENIVQAANAVEASTHIPVNPAVAATHPVASHKG